MSMICFDERERQVDSRSDAGGRPEATLVHGTKAPVQMLTSVGIRR
jgi:hypothetical protein